MRLSKIWFLLE